MLTLRVVKEGQDSAGSSETSLLVVNRNSRPVSTVEVNAGARKYEFSRWVDDLTFNLFVNGSPKLYRLIDLTRNNPLPFIPLTRGHASHFRPGFGMFNNITSRTTQLQFLQLAVALLSNNRTDGSVEHIVVDLCSDPRNLAVIKKVLKVNILSTSCFADQLLLPAVEHKHVSLINTLLKAGANALALRWRKDLNLSRITFTTQLSLTVPDSGLTWRQNTEDSALSLAVQMGDETIIRVLLDNLSDVPMDNVRRYFVHSEISRLGLELAMLKAVDRNEVSSLRLILGSSLMKNERSHVLSDALPRVLEHAVSMKYLESVSLLLSCSETSPSMDQRAMDMALCAAANGG